MATIIVCDGCNSKLVGDKKDIPILIVPTHLTSPNECVSYVSADESNGYHANGIKYDLCNTCYNEIMSSAHSKLMEIKSMCNRDLSSE